MPLSEKQILNMQTRRQIILDSATYLFATEGYEGTTIKKLLRLQRLALAVCLLILKIRKSSFILLL